VCNWQKDSPQPHGCGSSTGWVKQAQVVGGIAAPGASAGVATAAASGGINEEPIQLVEIRRIWEQRLPTMPAQRHRSSPREPRPQL